MSDPTQKISVFISYAHEDDEERKKLSSHLKTVRWLDIWDDREIPAGSEWDDEITVALQEADIILLVVSVDFMTSDYVSETEIPRALVRHNAGEARVVPVLLKPCNWKDNGIDHLNALPADEEWIVEWSSIDKAMLSVVEGIKATAEDLLEERSRKFQSLDDYRRKVAEALADHHISIGERDTLDEERQRLGLSEAEAKEIEDGALQTIEEKRENLARYRSTMAKVIANGLPITETDRDELKKRRAHLGLTDDDVAGIEEEETARWDDEATRAEAQREAEEAAARERAEREAAEQEAARKRAEAEREEAEARRRAARHAEGNQTILAWSEILSTALARAAETSDGTIVAAPDLTPDLVATARTECEVPDNDLLIAVTNSGLLPSVGWWAFGLQGIYVRPDDGAVEILPYAGLVELDMFATVPLGDDDDHSLLFAMFQVASRTVGVEEELDAIRRDLAERSTLDDLAPEIIESIEEREYAARELAERWFPVLVEVLESSPHDSLSVAPNISDRKLGNVGERYEVPAWEVAAGVIDNTAFGSAKDGLMFGRDGMYLHNSFDPDSGAQFALYADLSPFALSIPEDESNRVTIGETSFYTTCAEDTLALLVQVQATYYAVAVDVHRERLDRDVTSVNRVQALFRALHQSGLLAALHENEERAASQLGEALELAQRAHVLEPDNAELALDVVTALRTWSLFTDDLAPIHEAIELLDQLDLDPDWAGVVSEVRDDLVAIAAG